MRLNSIIIFAVLFFSTLTTTLSQVQDARPKFNFETKSIKFEKVKAGEVLSFYYVFENTGVQPLIITDIKVSCGCTKPWWPKKPIKPGDKDTIHVEFNTEGKIGWQDRLLEVYSNTNSPVKLRFKGMVDNKDKR